MHDEFDDMHLADITSRLDGWEEEITDRLTKLGYRPETFTSDHTNLHVRVMLRDGVTNTSRRIKSENEALSLFQALSYLHSIRDHVASGNYLRALKYALRLPFHLVSSDMRIADDVRRRSASGGGDTVGAKARHERWLAMAAGMRSHPPKLSKRRMADIISERETASGRPIGSDAVRKVLTKLGKRG